MKTTPRPRTVRSFLRQLRLNQSAIRQVVGSTIVGAYFCLGIVSTAFSAKLIGGAFPVVLGAEILLLICLLRRQALSAFRAKWRLLRETWALPGMIGKHVILRYPAELERQYDPSILLAQADEEFESLRARFGAAPRLGLTVVVLPWWMGEKNYGRLAGGLAVPPGIAIVSGDLPWYVSSENLGSSFGETVRHEFAHLFAMRCLGAWGGPLLNEGLAVWLQQTWRGQPTDQLALVSARRRGLSLRAMLKHPFFYDPRQQHDCYFLAGSFTGFLVRRLGWRRFWRFCHWTSFFGYRLALRHALGMTLAEAEARWRAELEITDRLRARFRTLPGQHE